MGFEKDMKIQLIKTEFGKKRNLKQIDDNETWYERNEKEVIK